MVAGDQRSKYRSRFGGFWIDRHDADELLADRLRTGALGPELAERIQQFMRDGYVVIPGAVPLSLTQAIREELDEYWATPPSGALIETTGVKTRLVTPELDLRDRPHKLLDFHAHSALARQAAAAPPVVEFLTAIFEASPKAFQTLTFWKGSQQPFHKDTAYVRIESEPMHLAASWIALEDIRRGSGELPVLRRQPPGPGLPLRWRAQVDGHGASGPPRSTCSASGPMPSGTATPAGPSWPRRVTS